MASISQGLRRIKSELLSLVSPELIHRLCIELKYEWRDRTLDPVTTVHLFLAQVLHGNVACAGVRHLSSLSFTASAYCQARMRLPLELLVALAEHVARQVRAAGDGVGLWYGHRTFLVDGSSFSMSDTPELAGRFGYPGGQKAGCGFPTAHLLAMFDAASGFLMHVSAAPVHTGDMPMVRGAHAILKPGDVLIADRAYCSFAHLALLCRQHLHAVLRINQTIVSFRRNRPHNDPRRRPSRKGIPRSRWVRRLDRDDQIVEWLKPNHRPPWMSIEEFRTLPDRITVRESRYRVTRSGFRTHTIMLVTTLLNPDAYPLSALADLYHSRWQIETNIRHLKQSMKMEVLHCRTVNGVMKELMIFTIVYNLVRCVMLEASRRQGVPPDQISFIDALRWIAARCPGEDVPSFVVNPWRPGRTEPRAVKRRPKPYILLTCPRAEARKSLARHRVAT